MIFIEHDLPLSKEEIDKKMEILQKACETEDDDLVRDALREVVPTFKRSDEVNAKSIEVNEKNNQPEPVLS